MENIVIKNNPIENVYSNIKMSEDSLFKIKLNNTIQEISSRGLFNTPSEYSLYLNVYENYIWTIFDKLISDLKNRSLDSCITINNEIFINLINNVENEIISSINKEILQRNNTQQKQTILNRYAGSIKNKKEQIIKYWNNEAEIIKTQNLLSNKTNFDENLYFEIDRINYLLPKNLVGYREDMNKFLKNHTYNKNIFLMIRYRSYNIELKEKLKDYLINKGYNLIIAGSKPITDELNNVVACLFCCKYGLVIFDKSEDEDDSTQEINPNVCYELAYMHSFRRQILILKDKKIRPPSDILAKIYEEAEINNDSKEDFDDTVGMYKIIDDWLKSLD